MAYQKILPSTVLLFVDLAGGTTFVVLGCLTSVSFAVNNNEIDANSMCGADKLPGLQEYTASADGQLIQFAVADAAFVGHFDMLTAAKNKTIIGFKIGPAVPTSGQVVTTGTAFVAGYDTTYDADNAATFSMTLGIRGIPLFVKTV